VIFWIENIRFIYRGPGCSFRHNGKKSGGQLAAATVAERLRRHTGLLAEKSGKV
jgi:hypothetical protein